VPRCRSRQAPDDSGAISGAAHDAWIDHGLHGLTTAPQSGFGNFILPIQIGAEDMAFPVLNMLSFWVTFLSLVVLISAFFVTGGAPISGWTAYPPLSALGKSPVRTRRGTDIVVIGVAIFCIGALLGPQLHHHDG